MPQSITDQTANTESTIVLNEGERILNGVNGLQDVYYRSPDLYLTMERTEEGLLLFLRSEFLARYILEHGTNPTFYGSRYQLTRNSVGMSEDNGFVRYIPARIYNNRVRGYITIPFHNVLFDMSDGMVINQQERERNARNFSRGIQVLYTQPIPETSFRTIRLDILRGYEEFIRDIQREYMSTHSGYNYPLVNLSMKSIPRKKNGTFIKDGVIYKKITAVNTVAVEFEGFWFDGHVPDGVYSDCSVSNALRPRCQCEDRDACPSCNGVIGEATSGICTPDTIDEWMGLNHPDKVDASCGMHVHVGFNNDLLAYSKLMTPTFHRYFLKRFNDWGKRMNINEGSRFWVRIQGQNRFAMDKFRATKQYLMTHKSVERYTFLNFCWGLHGTLENRMLPMFNESRIAVSAVHEFIDIVNSYLAENIDEAYSYEVVA